MVNQRSNCSPCVTRNIKVIIVGVLVVQILLFLIWIEMSQNQQSLHLLVENVDVKDTLLQQKTEKDEDQSTDQSYYVQWPTVDENNSAWNDSYEEIWMDTDGNDTVATNVTHGAVESNAPVEVFKLDTNGKRDKNREASYNKKKTLDRNAISDGLDQGINGKNEKVKPSEKLRHDGTGNGREIKETVSNVTNTKSDISDELNLLAIQAKLSFSRIESKASVLLEAKLRHARGLLRQWEKLNPNFTVPPDQKEYFIKVGEMKCLKEGSNMSLVNQSMQACPCLEKWYGKHCSIPEAVVKSPQYPELKNITLRDTPRRLVNSIPFAFEWDLLELRLYDTGDIIDAFLILDSIYTAYGDLRDLALLPRLLNGSYGEVGQKVIPVVLDTFPEVAQTNGWVFDGLYRDFPFSRGIPQQLQGISDDDFLIVNDADEVPTRDVLLFLKLHNNIPEPFGFRFRSTKFGFFWFDMSLVHQVGATFKMFREAFRFSATQLRSFENVTRMSAIVDGYRKTNPGGVVMDWTIGNPNHPSAIHCTWCFTPENMQIKLVSGINGDFLRWGDYPHKCQISYIESLIARGMWFTETKCMHEAPRENPNYAPKYMLRHFQKYRHLLENPYKKKECVRKAEIQYTSLVKGWHRLSKVELDKALNNHTVNGNK